MSEVIALDEFVFETRNDFTVKELESVLRSGEEVQVYERYRENENYGTQPDGSWTPYYSDELIGIELTEIEDFHYEGGKIQGFGTFKAVGRWNLGDGHECGVVWKHEESGRHFRQSGWYSSWDSGDWDGDLEEVEAVEVTVTRYKSKSGTVYEYPIVS